jgi:hypothetical protein
MTTEAPSSAKATAVACPIPELEPVYRVYIHIVFKRENLIPFLPVMMTTLLVNRVVNGILKYLLMIDGSLSYNEKC